MLEASFIIFESRTRLQRSADARKATDSTCGFILVEAQSRGTTLFTYHEAVDHTDAWSILGEKVDISAEAVYTRL